MFSFAHISDIHLPPLPKVWPWHLANKRVLGYLSWHRKRKAQHRREVLEALIRDLGAHNPGHICVTGDMVNLALPQEFEGAAAWLENLAPKERISLVPGNHDTYVRSGMKMIHDYFDPWMGSAFPFVHRKGPLAFIGVSTAVPTPPFMATGEAGRDQLTALEHQLESLKRDNTPRIVLIHHPPQPDAAKWRKRMRDAEAFRHVIRRTGAEMVLHGHLHRPVQDTIPGPDGPVPVFGAGAASYLNSEPEKSGHYHLFKYEKNSVHISYRHYDAGQQKFVTLSETKTDIAL